MDAVTQQPNIRELIYQRGFRFEWIAEQLGLGQSTLTRAILDRGRVTVGEREKLAELLSKPGAAVTVADIDAALAETERRPGMRRAS